MRVCTEQHRIGIGGRTCFDWSATLDGYEPGDPIGYGATEEDAIADLMEQVEDE